MQGQLFTQYFLTDAIKSTEDWRATRAHPDAFNQFRDGARRLLEDFAHYQDPNEATTERDLIGPLLELLGWADYLPQQSTRHGEDVPDLLLFADADAKMRAASNSNSDDRFLDALVVGESKRLGRPLDAPGSLEILKVRATQTAMLDVPAVRPPRHRDPGPHSQMLRYLRTADSVTDGRLHWGILTNGGVWRLYDQRARPRATGYFEADLAALIAGSGSAPSVNPARTPSPGGEGRGKGGPSAADGLRTFFLLFRRDAFVQQPGATTTFVESALAEGRRYEQRVAEDLSGVVFERAFPDLIEALLDAGGGSLADARQAALVLLYRLLFVLYAEDRGLLPVSDTRYDDYGLRKRVRDDIARRMHAGDTFSSHAGNYYDRVMTLSRQIDAGDDSIGLPPYNGGLFAAGAAPLLGKVRLSDAAFAPIVHDLSHTEAAGRRQFVNYRDMTVQQLGSIYERLLEREPVRNSRGEIETRLNPFARKDSGSFYTPQELVDLILDQTLKPQVEERLKAFEEKAMQLKGDRRRKSDRKAELRRLDPAEAVLDLKVLDPAMGSGHFLVTAVDYLADYVADLIEYVPAVPDWLDGDDAYESPLLERVARIRDDLLQRARNPKWVMDEAQLSDQNIIRRMVLKRCIYGVDKNPLTVELAKVSLWLHSFTVGAPLSFLDHHLRCGDSLLGLRVLDARQDFQRLGGLSASTLIAGAENATEGMQRIERLSDADVAEVKESAGLFQDVEQATADLRGVLDFLSGLRWQTAGLKKGAQADVNRLLAETLGRESSIAFDLLARGPEAADETISRDLAWESFADRWTQSRSVADREGFLHWEVAFPGVWRNWQSREPVGGFDAVIGNPPWDQIEQKEVEWFALRDNEVALASTGAARKALIAKRLDADDELALEYTRARDRATAMRIFARAGGQYPLLSSGRINLYSLFVERAMGLVKPDGFVGLLTPSGIYADKTAARFFKTVSTSGRVGGLFDFENKKIFFKDIHASFKFCALVFGGAKRTFAETRCGFFLHDAETINDPDRCFALSPDDFARVNPNTGTAPIFRTRRDAEITRRIYANHPVLVDRSGREERRTWPVRYLQGLFNMTSDSHLFRTAAQLEEEGFYPLQGNIWKKGPEQYLPLYQGRVIQHFDHRANSVRVNLESTHNPYLSEEVSEAQHEDPHFHPNVRHFVPDLEVSQKMPRKSPWTIAYRPIARPTDIRTMIATIVPRAGFGHSVFLLMPESGFGSREACLLTANLNSHAFDFATRQKMHGTNLSWYLLEQLPVIAPDAYERRLGEVTAAELVRDHVLRLIYTAHDMEPFARDLGYGGPPFIWEQVDRRHLRARLDALYFHLYGLDRADAAYVLDTFPIVRREDQTQFNGQYRTKDLILAYMNALAAGDTETVVAV
ncbi:MAG: Eco57I restriction-modification methylase domain-containing protein [Chloroflexi bacterium]|nr:Eco57I restriction-modification methylase domain-containing protein [Chloroflexota bacterium]